MSNLANMYMQQAQQAQQKKQGQPSFASGTITQAQPMMPPPAPSMFQFAPQQSPGLPPMGVSIGGARQPAPMPSYGQPASHIMPQMQPSGMKPQLNAGLQQQMTMQQPAQSGPSSQHFLGAINALNNGTAPNQSAAPTAMATQQPGPSLLGSGPQQETEAQKQRRMLGQ